MNLAKKVPAVLRDAGLTVEQHSKHFRADAKDDDWLPVVCKQNWIVLTRDWHMRFRARERDSIFLARGRALILIGDAPNPELADKLRC